jgi:hypothetical protein
MDLSTHNNKWAGLSLFKKENCSLGPTCCSQAPLNLKIPLGVIWILQAEMSFILEFILQKQLTAFLNFRIQHIQGIKLLMKLFLLDFSFFFLTQFIGLFLNQFRSQLTNMSKQVCYGYIQHQEQEI